MPLSSSNTTRSGSRVAVFIDADNILIPARAAGVPNPVSELMYYVRREATPQGSVVFARAYGDWTQTPCRDHVSECQARCVEAMMLASDARGKNTADVQLAVDVMEMVLSEAPPTVVVLASGDRDFIPLVQKVRRYSSEVWGIGVRGCVRRELEEACTRFVYLDALVDADAEGATAPLSQLSPPAVTAPEVVSAEPAAQAASPVVAQPGPVTQAQALRALREAVAHQLERGVSALGSRTYELMRQALPGWTYGDLGYESFRAFVQASGISVAASEFGVGDMRLELPRSLAPPEPSGPHDACEHYRQILLNEKGVPLVAWRQRKTLVRHLWSILERFEEGMTIQDMNDALVEHAYTQGFHLPDRALQKISHTLNIAHCFEHEGRVDYFTDIFEVRLLHAKGLSADGALSAMNRVYVNGLRWSHREMRLIPEGVALLLFDEDATTHQADARALVDFVDGPTSAGPIGQQLQQMGWSGAAK